MKTITEFIGLILIGLLYIILSIVITALPIALGIWIVIKIIS